MQNYNADQADRYSVQTGRRRFEKGQSAHAIRPDSTLNFHRMKDCFVLALLISTFPYEIANSLKTPVVRTPSGPVRGLISRTVWHSIKYSSFKGIPYAKPPLGDLRFKVWKKFYSIIPLFNWKFTKDFIYYIFDFFFAASSSDRSLEKSVARLRGGQRVRSMGLLVARLHGP